MLRDKRSILSTAKSEDLSVLRIRQTTAPHSARPPEFPSKTVTPSSSDTLEGHQQHQPVSRDHGSRIWNSVHHGWEIMLSVTELEVHSSSYSLSQPHPKHSQSSNCKSPCGQKILLSVMAIKTVTGVSPKPFSKLVTKKKKNKPQSKWSMFTQCDAVYLVFTPSTISVYSVWPRVFLWHILAWYTGSILALSSLH